MKKVTNAIREYFKTTDKWLLFFWLGASAVSLLFLYALAVCWPEEYSIKIQVAATILGIVSALVISLLDYHTLLKLWRVYVPLIVLLMLYTLFFGVGVGDSNRNWIRIPLGSSEFSLQPSEFLKIAFITTLSMHISKTREHLSSIGNVALLVLHCAAYLVLMYQDNGSMLVFAAIFVTVLFCAGIQWRYIFAAAATVTAAVPVLWYKLMSEDQRVRILVVRQPDLNPAGAYQQLWGLFALATGGREGTGLFAPSHVYVPAIHTDMIFAFIGESAGFMGCLGVIALLTVISLKILYNSTQTKDDTGRYICVGIFAMIISQTFINLGMCLRVTPVIGVTLPLISSGGTSVLSLYIALGLVLSVYRNSNTGLFSEKSA